MPMIQTKLQSMHYLVSWGKAMMYDDDDIGYF